MFGGDEIDIVASSNILKLHVPLSKFLWSEIEAIALMSDVVVLAEDATQVAAGEEDATGPIMALQAWLWSLLAASPMKASICSCIHTFSKVWGDSIDLDLLCANQAHACFLIAIHSA